MKKVDLHIHTNLSDGSLTPEEVVIKAINSGCREIAITDHEILTDFSNLEKKYDITIIPGIEFNTSISNLHLLGYNIDDFSLVNKTMLDLRQRNQQVCYQVISLLKNGGYDISLPQIEEYMKEIHLEYDIIDKRKIVKYLIHKGYANNVKDAYQKLIGKEAKYYVPNYKISPVEIISLILETGGIPALAHPGSISENNNEIYKTVELLVSNGLQAIEIKNKKMGIDNPLFEDLARNFHLIRTVGSDFHEKTDEIGLSLEEDIYEEINENIIQKRKNK